MARYALRRPDPASVRFDYELEVSAGPVPGVVGLTTSLKLYCLQLRCTQHVLLALLLSRASRE